ncbi:hypothetical protein PR003_g9138 [Phytophthora rubi]|uniref:RxLR effector protein n=1 Tax=Phytophthora rubi TaxID=129364 RepID=A0A6A4FIZ6_9STRA|nr:hypothetical protein PR002_g8879 [Phytophthora rubi]KAE9037040.1 hypothetical protein PR001_g8557 [Phytophthora rubi]KAE9343132.1 hypothetical protein PR003_g9138 [Phytophthora rubi]
MSALACGLTLAQAVTAAVPFCQSPRSFFSVAASAEDQPDVRLSARALSHADVAPVLGLRNDSSN